MASDTLKGGQPQEPEGSGEPSIRMSAEAQDRASTHQAGNDQHINTYHYNYAPPPPTPPTNGSAGAEEGAGGGGSGWFSGHKAAWISAAAAVLVAVIGVLGSYLGEGDDSTDKAGSGSSASSGASASQSAGAANPTPTPTPTPSTQSPAATPAGEQWQGVLALDDQPGGNKDLDPVQPVSTGDPLDDKTDFFGYFGEIRARNGSKASIWTGTGLPDYAGCASTVDAAGAEAQPVEVGTVLCIRTSEGRVGRLKATVVGDGNTSVQFDGVVWGLAE